MTTLADIISEGLENDRKRREEECRKLASQGISRDEITRRVYGWWMTNEQWRRYCEDYGKAFKR